MSMLRTGFVVLGICGAFAFGAAFFVSYLNPVFVEQTAKQIIRYQVEKDTREKLAALDAPDLAQRAGRLSRNYAGEIALAKRQLAEGLPERIAGIIAQMSDLDCDCRRRIERSIRGGFEWRIATASQASERLDTLIRSRYIETAESLTREFRIFTATNAIVFALFSIAAALRRQAGWHLVPPAIVLLVAAGLTAYFYLFQQNWLHTILFSDYVGMSYVAYLGVVFFFLCDILFNRGRITTRLLNRLLDALGSAVIVTPC